MLPHWKTFHLSPTLFAPSVTNTNGLTPAGRLSSRPRATVTASTRHALKTAPELAPYSATVHQQDPQNLINYTAGRLTDPPPRLGRPFIPGSQKTRLVGWRSSRTSPCRPSSRLASVRNTNRVEVENTRTSGWPSHLAPFMVELAPEKLHPPRSGRAPRPSQARRTPFGVRSHRSSCRTTRRGV